MELDKPITIAVLLFIILVLSFYLVLPKYKEFQVILEDLGKREAEFTGKDAYFIEVTRTHKELMLYKENLEKIDIALPKKFSFASLLNFLHKETTAVGLILENVSVSKADVGTTTGIKEIGLSLQLFGSYVPLEQFIRSLENSARLIEGENISFLVAKPTAEDKESGKSYPISLDIKVYSY